MRENIEPFLCHTRGFEEDTTRFFEQPSSHFRFDLDDLDIAQLSIKPGMIIPVDATELYRLDVLLLSACWERKVLVALGLLLLVGMVVAG